MSLVLAIKDRDRIILGADKQISDSGSGSADHTSTKIWAVEELPGAIMGGVGSARASQIIQYTDIIDKNLINKDVDTSFIIRSLVPTIVASLKANGIDAEIKDGNPCVMLPNSFIFAYKDKAWVIWNDLSVAELDEYLAIGSGSEVAKGALFVTKNCNPFDRIAMAIGAAAETTLFVDDRIDLLATEIKDGDDLKIAKALGLEFEKSESELKKEAKKETKMVKPKKSITDKK
jgi:ATP-dependent protease HslVU (ClpYQ) peptidase subunit